jgi:hypothetical protein
MQLRIALKNLRLQLPASKFVQMQRSNHLVVKDKQTVLAIDVELCSRKHQEIAFTKISLSQF